MKGGDGGTNAGGGGGGRMIIRYLHMPYWFGELNSKGGSGYMVGGAGTVYLEVLTCQPRVTVMSCFVYKVIMGI